MNYYIQGDPAKAEQIKAAFERNGIDTSANSNYGISNLFYFSCNVEVAVTQNGSIINLIKTHPDYKKLELLIEPKFKINDWIIFDRTFTIPIQIVEVNQKDNIYVCMSIEGLCGNYDITHTDKNYHLWTIQDAKPGDVLIDGTTNTIGIFKEINKTHWYSKVYCGNATWGSVFSNGGLHKIECTKPATKEQRDLLAAKLKEAGYEWNDEKKEWMKIKPHYDISNFKPFNKVLCRGHNRQAWRPSLYGFYDTTLKYPMFVCATANYLQCIPFEGNEHLLGTTDMCDEQYINW